MGQRLSRTLLQSTVTVASFPITVSNKLKTRGVTLDAALTAEEYVNSVAKACNFHIWGLRHICRSMSRDVANTMAACIVGTRFDYCNALSYGSTGKSLNKLQIVQNKLSWVVCNVTTRQQYTIDLLRNLHWLPISSRITFKVAAVCYKAYRLHRHTGAIRAMPWTKICWDGLADSTTVAYQNSGTPFLFYNANSLEWTSTVHS